MKNQKFDKLWTVKTKISTNLEIKKPKFRQTLNFKNQNFDNKNQKSDKLWP